MKQKSVSELKWTNQNFTDYRLHQWLIEHQTAVFEALQKPNFEAIKKAVASANIIYRYYFRLLIHDDETIKNYDTFFEQLWEAIKNAQKKENKVILPFDVLKKTIEAVSELSRVVQQGKYFFNISIESKSFADALEQLKQIGGDKE